jgi:hypothetical protein
VEAAAPAVGAEVSADSGAGPPLLLAGAQAAAAAAAADSTTLLPVPLIKRRRANTGALLVLLVLVLVLLGLLLLLLLLVVTAPSGSGVRGEVEVEAGASSGNLCWILKTTKLLLLFLSSFISLTSPKCWTVVTSNPSSGTMVRGGLNLMLSTETVCSRVCSRARMLAALLELLLLLVVLLLLDSLLLLVVLLLLLTARAVGGHVQTAAVLLLLLVLWQGRAASLWLRPAALLLLLGRARGKVLRVGTGGLRKRREELVPVAALKRPGATTFTTCKTNTPHKTHSESTTAQLAHQLLVDT